MYNNIHREFSPNMAFVMHFSPFAYRLENIARKEKLLVTSNFSLSHNVFHSYISLVHQNVALWGNELNPIPSFNGPNENGF